MKNIFLTLVTLLFGYVAFSSFQNISSANSDETISPPKNNFLSKTKSSTSQLRGISSAPNSPWINSPFGTSIPTESLHENDSNIQKKQLVRNIVFEKPNTEWKSRQIILSDGRTPYYEFGKGNPKEVALDVTGIQQELRACAITPDSKERICRDGEGGYVTPELELALKTALESPLWEKLVNECYSEYSTSRYYNRFKERVLAPHRLDISRFLIVDPVTGRKELERINVDDIGSEIAIIGTNESLPENMYGRSTSASIFYPCFERYGKPLSKMFSNIGAAYWLNITTSSIEEKSTLNY